MKVNEESLKAWEQDHIEILTSKEMGEWLHRRDMNARPQGEWIVDKNNVFQNYMKCSICNEGAEWLDGGSQFLSNYCPNCGAKMLGGSK